jgi:tripartite-type tricarboxylate transporter receptor subunit TctC
MKFKRRTLLAALGTAACLPVIPAAMAQNFPSKIMALVVPYSAGGPTDAMARTLAAAIKPILGQTMIVENKAGAGSNIGAEYVARSAPDGYTLMFGTSAPLGINRYLYRKIGYDPFKSFAPVIQIGYLPNVLVVHPSLPVKDVQELIAYAKAHKGTLSFASSGSGASSHLAGELFNIKAGTDFMHVPYKGTGPALNDLVGGQVNMSFTDVLTALPFIQTGKLRVLGVTTLQRSRALPDVPTLAEQGLKDFDASVFFGIVVPAGTPQATIDRLNGAFVEVMGDPAVKERLEKQGLEPPRNFTPAELARYMESEVVKWREVIKVSGARAD